MSTFGHEALGLQPEDPKHIITWNPAAAKNKQALQQAVHLWLLTF